VVQNDELQPLVDALAERLQRSVAIDDPSIRLLAASRHFGDEDELRVTSVINRAVPVAVLERVKELGAPQWTEPGYLRLCDDCGVHAEDRMGVPVRCNGMHLGYLWLIDRQHTLTDEEIAAASDTAARAGVVLYRRLLLLERSKTRHEAILRELVSTDPVIREQAVQDLREEDLFPERSVRYQVLAIQCAQAETSGGPHDVAIEAAAEEGVRSMPEGCTLLAANRSRAWILVAAAALPGPHHLATTATRITERFHSLTGAEDPIAVGVGEPVDTMETVVDSYQQAFLAARAALLVPALGGFARWGHLGPYDLLLRMRHDDVLHAARIPALEALEAGDTHGFLGETLEVFFDNACDVRRTVDQLCIHRSTLYHRLKRVEQLSGCCLDRGDDRLTLHLGVKLRRLAAAYRAQTSLPD
jgi:PucR C-terminal helix-turn-helix domain/GGDEF-like domain